MTRTYNNYEDLITFTRASKGHALRPVSYGAELVTNGTFDTDSDWQKGTGWSISGGVAVSAGSNNYAGLQQSPSLVVGKIYSVTFTISSYTSGGVKIGLGETVGVTYSAEGTYTETFVYTGPHVSGFKFSIFPWGAFVGSIDNISVKEVLFDQPDGTLTLFEHPNNVPRVEYDADGNRLGLLVEESRTNQFTYSVPDTANWGTLRASLDENQITAPDGTNTASNFIADSGSIGSHFFLDTSITSGTTYTQSLFAKAKDTSWIQITPSTGFSSGHQNFNLQTGSLGGSSNVTSASITDVGNGWYRCSVTVTATGTVTGRMVFGWIGGDDGRLDTDGSFTPDGTQGVYVWGAQLEEGSFPTSYIKTTGSTATRSADVASIPVADFGFNAGAGSFVLDAKWAGYKSDVSAIVHLGDSSDRHLIYYNSGSYRYQVKSGNTVTAQITASGAEENDVIAASYKKDSFFFGDGSAINSDTSGALPAEVLTTLDIGGYLGDNHFNGHIKSIKYYPRQLTSAQLGDLVE